MDKDNVSGDYDKVLLYKQLFSTEEGERVLEDLKRACHYDSFELFNLTDAQLLRLNTVRSVINYIQYLRDREEPQQPEEMIELDLVNGI